MARSDVWIGRFSRHLRAGRKSERTVKIYTEAVRDFARWSEDADLLKATRADLEGFMVDCNTRLSSSTTNQRFRSLQQFYRWLEEDEEVERSPMAKMKPPPIDELSVPVLPPESLTRLLATKKTKSFEHRRDTAIILLFIDTGVRVGEMFGITLEDIDLDARAIHVVGKGRKPRTVVYGHTTAKALDKYLRVRDDVPNAHMPWLWISKFGRFTDWGIRQMLERACKEAAIPHINPHQFRHTFSHEWLAAGGEGEDLMRLNGWRSRSMLTRYGASAAAERAQDAYRRRPSPGDRL